VLASARRFRLGFKALEVVVDEVGDGEDVGCCCRRFALRDEAGMGEARGVPRTLALLLLPPPLLLGFFAGFGATACLTLRTSVLTLNLDF